MGRFGLVKHVWILLIEVLVLNLWLLLFLVLWALCLARVRVGQHDLLDVVGGIQLLVGILNLQVFQMVKIIIATLDDHVVRLLVERRLHLLKLQATQRYIRWLLLSILLLDVEGR